jgi:hypothetical protein
MEFDRKRRRTSSQAFMSRATKANLAMSRQISFIIIVVVVVVEASAVED